MSTETTRLSVEIPMKDHRKLKILAEANGLTLRELVLIVLEPVLYPKKTPNAVTQKAIKDTKKGIGLKTYEDVDHLWEVLGLD